MEALSLEEKRQILKEHLSQKIQLRTIKNEHYKGSFLKKKVSLLNRRRLKLDDLGYNFFERELDEYHGAWVVVNGRRMLMMSSYSYLGLIGHERINKAAESSILQHGTGTHGVRVLAGTLNHHRQLEETIASFKKTEDAIAFSSGYVANLSTISTLTGSGDVVICDSFDHASIIDGCKLSNAEFRYFDHNDMDSLRHTLKLSGKKGKLVVVDGVFSMDGDIADIPGILELCRQYNACLMVDEAHSTGMIGSTGQGIDEHFGLDPDDIDIKMGTLSKTIPAVGGYVAGKSELVKALKANANGYFFSAAIPPAVAASAKAAFDVIRSEPDRVKKLHRNMRRYLDGIKKLGFKTLNSETAIVPIVCNHEQNAFEMTRICQEEGLFVLPVLYPAVPLESPRLRTTVTTAHSDEDIDFCLSVFETAGRRTGLI